MSQPSSRPELKTVTSLRSFAPFCRRVRGRVSYGLGFGILHLTARSWTSARTTVVLSTLRYREVVGADVWSLIRDV